MVRQVNQQVKGGYRERGMPYWVLPTACQSACQAMHDRPPLQVGGIQCTAVDLKVVSLFINFYYRRGEQSIGLHGFRKEITLNHNHNTYYNYVLV